MKRKWIFMGPLAILGIVAFIFIGGEVVMRLWNWLLPALFGFRQITFWQALGLLILCRILFGGFHGHGARPGWRSRRRMRERWEQMTPEEREKYRQRFGGYCGPASAEPKPMP